MLKEGLSKACTGVEGESHTEEHLFHQQCAWQVGWGWGLGKEREMRRLCTLADNQCLGFIFAISEGDGFVFD